MADVPLQGQVAITAINTDTEVLSNGGSIGAGITKGRLSHIYANNFGTTTATVTVWHEVGGATKSDKQRYTAKVPPGYGVSLADGVTVTANDKLIAQSTALNVNITANGWGE
jgi:hypothetical protein